MGYPKPNLLNLQGLFGHVPLSPVTGESLCLRTASGSRALQHHSRALRAEHMLSKDGSPNSGKQLVCT